MRKSKTRKSEKKARAAECRKFQKTKRRLRRAKDIRYHKWLMLPEEAWSDARKKRNLEGIQND
jgi:hypothetical protein